MTRREFNELKQTIRKHLNLEYNKFIKGVLNKYHVDIFDLEFHKKIYQMNLDRMMREDQKRNLEYNKHFSTMDVTRMTRLVYEYMKEIGEYDLYMSCKSEGMNYFENIRLLDGFLSRAPYCQELNISVFELLDIDPCGDELDEYILDKLYQKEEFDKYNNEVIKGVKRKVIEVGEEITEPVEILENNNDKTKVKK